jgi:hypothetical protein
MRVFAVVRLGMTPEEMAQQLNQQAAEGWNFVAPVYNDANVMGIFSREKAAKGSPKGTSRAQQRETR